MTLCCCFWSLTPWDEVWVFCRSLSYGVWPAELRAPAADAEALAARTAEVAARLQAAPDDHLQRLAQPIAKATHDLSDYTDEVSRTAEDLARVRVARDPGLCDIPWGVCPDHGVTLHSSGGRAWCTDPAAPARGTTTRLHTLCRAGHRGRDRPGRRDREAVRSPRGTRAAGFPTAPPPDWTTKARMTEPGVAVAAGAVRLCDRYREGSASGPSFPCTSW